MSDKKILYNIRIIRLRRCCSHMSLIVVKTEYINFYFRLDVGIDDILRNTVITYTINVLGVLNSSTIFWISLAVISWSNSIYIHGKQIVELLFNNNEVRTCAFLIEKTRRHRISADAGELLIIRRLQHHAIVIIFSPRPKKRERLHVCEMAAAHK